MGADAMPARPTGAVRGGSGGGSRICRPDDGSDIWDRLHHWGRLAPPRHDGAGDQRPPGGRSRRGFRTWWRRQLPRRGGRDADGYHVVDLLQRRAGGLQANGATRHTSPPVSPRSRRSSRAPSARACAVAGDPPRPTRDVRPCL